MDNKKEKKEQKKPGEEGAFSLQQLEETLPQPTQPPITAPNVFPFRRDYTPELAEIMSVTGICPGNEDPNDPLKIHPDVMDTMMGWDINAIYANNRHVRMPYTRMFRTEEQTPETPASPEELSPLHKFKEFKPRALQAKDSASSGSGDGGDSTVSGTPRDPIAQSEEESKTSEDDIYNLAPHNRPQRQAASRGYRGRGEGYKYNTPRVPFQRFTLTKVPQYPPLPPPQPQRPYVQKNQWPCLGSPRSASEQPQDSGRQVAHQGKPSFRGRKSAFKKYTRTEQSEEETALPDGDKLPKIKEEVFPEETAFGHRMLFERGPPRREEQAGPSRETRDEAASAGRYFKPDHQKFPHRNTPENITTREDVQIPMPQSVSGLELQPSQVPPQGPPQFPAARLPPYTSVGGQPQMANAQPIYYSPVYPGFSNPFDQQQQANPGQLQTSSSASSTSQEDTQPDPNMPIYPIPLTREQYEMQAQYQQFFNQQRQLFYQMQHQQQQQFMQLQLQQQSNQQQQQQQQLQQQSQQQQRSTQLQQQHSTQLQQQHSTQLQQQSQLCSHQQQTQQCQHRQQPQQQTQQYTQQQQHIQQSQQQIYYQQQQQQQPQQQPQPIWHPDIPPPNIPVVQGFVPPNYSIPPPSISQYQQQPPRRQHREAESTLPEISLPPCETEEPRLKAKSKKKSKNTILNEYPHMPQGTIQYIRPNTLSSIVSQSSMRNVPLPTNVLESYKRPPEPTLLEEASGPSTPRELTEEEIFKRDNPLAYELSKLPQRFGVVPQTCSNSSDSSTNDLMY